MRSAPEHRIEVYENGEPGPNYYAAVVDMKVMATKTKVFKEYLKRSRPDEYSVLRRVGAWRIELYSDPELAAEAAVSYTHLRAHETDSYLVCRLLLEKKK